ARRARPCARPARRRGAARAHLLLSDAAATFARGFGRDRSGVPVAVARLLSERAGDRGAVRGAPCTGDALAQFAILLAQPVGTLCETLQLAREGGHLLARQRQGLGVAGGEPRAEIGKGCGHDAPRLRAPARDATLTNGDRTRTAAPGRPRMRATVWLL